MQCRKCNVFVENPRDSMLDVPPDERAVLAPDQKAVLCGRCYRKYVKEIDVRKFSTVIVFDGKVYGGKPMRSES